MSTQESKVLTAHIPLAMAEKIDRIAAQLDRSKGWIVKQALADWIAQQESHRRLTLEAMADVDAGRVIDHDIMVSWAASLPPNPSKTTPS